MPADLPPLGTTAVEVEADSSALDKAFDQDIPRKAQEGARRAGLTAGQQLSESLRSSIASRQQEIRQALEKGLINEEQAADLARRAARGFTTQFNRNLRELGKQGIKVDVVDEAAVRSEIRELSNLIPREVRQAARRAEPELRRSGEQAGRAYAGGFRAITTGLFAGIGLAVGNILARAARRALIAIPRFARASVEAFQEQERATARLAATLATMGIEGEDALKKITDRASELQRQTTASDDALTNAVATLGLLATALSPDDLVDAQEAIVAISDVFLGGNVENAAQLLGKTLGSTTNALTRYGIQVDTSASQSEKLRQVIEQTAGMFDVSKEAARTLEGRIAQLKNAFNDAQETIGALIVDFLDLTDNTGKATNAVQEFDRFLQENRAGVLRLGNVLKGLGGVALNTVQVVGDAIVLLLASVHRTILEFTNLAARGLNLIIRGANAIPGVDFELIPLANVERADELIEKAQTNIVRNVGEIGQAFRQMGAEIPPAADRAVTGVRRVGTESEDAAEKVKKLRQELDRLVREGVPLSLPVDDLTLLQNRLDAIGANVVDLIPVARRLGITLEELATKILDGADASEDMNTEIVEMASEYEQLQDVLDAVNDGLDEHEKRQREARRELEDTIEDFARGARGVIDFAEALGVLDDAAADTLRAMTNLGEGIAQIATSGGNPAQILSGSLQALGGLAQIGSALFGESRVDVEQKELRAAMNRLRESVDRMGDLFAQTTGVVTTGLERLARIDPSSLRGEVFQFLDPDKLRDQLKGLGLTLADLERFARDADIPIDDLIAALDGLDHSSLLASSQFRELQDAIILAANAARTFQEDLATLELEFELFDVDAPADQFARIIDTALERGFGEAGALTRRRLAGLEGLDLTDPADVEKAREVFRSIFRDIEAARRGDLAAADVFGQLTGPELERLLRDGNSLLEQILEDAGLGSEVAGTTQQGGIFRGVSIGQGDALITLGQTQVAYLQDIAISARDLAGRPTDGFLFQPIDYGQPTPSDSGFAPGQAVTGAGAPNAPTPPPIPTGTPTLSSPSITYAVTVGDLNFGDLSLPSVRDGQSFSDSLRDLSGRRLSALIEQATREQLENRGVT